MPWTWDEIKRVWLRDVQITDPPAEVWVDHFNVVERYFGRDWLDHSRFKNGVETWGPEPALYLGSQGARLACLDGVPGADHLIERLRRRDDDAWAELTALWLLKSADLDVLIEVEPRVPGLSSVPDFRARRGSDVWTYVEVTQPNMSEEHQRLNQILARLGGLLDAVPGRYALEVFLRRAPSTDELQFITRRIPDICRMDGLYVEELPQGLGTLYLNETAPGRVELRDHGEEYRPRLGRANSRVGNGVAQRHIAIRLAFTDERAEAFLDSEARQLPKDAPGLIMIQTSGATGAFKQWEPTLRRRLRPKLHTRVSGICLFQSGMVPTEKGEAWRPESRTLVNPNAPLQLPAWVVTNLGRFPPMDAEDLIATNPSSTQDSADIPQKV